MGLLLISFFEKPDWCLRNPRLNATDNCNTPDNMITNSNIIYLNPIASRVL